MTAWSSSAEHSPRRSGFSCIGKFTAAEKGALFRHGIEAITDAGGTYTNQATEVDALDDDVTSGIAGSAIFIDADRNARVFEDDQAFNTLTVSVVNGAATDRVAVAKTGTVELIAFEGALRVFVKGINIGFVATEPGGPLLKVQFNDRSTPDLVQELLRALTYTDATGAATADRQIKITLTDYTLLHSTDAEVTVKQELNQAPVEIALEGDFVPEAASAGTLVSVLSATDPNATDDFTFTLLNDAGGRFRIVGNKLVVNRGIMLDYEQERFQDVTVQVTDKLGLSVTKTFTIGIGAVANEVAVGSSARDTIVGGSGADRLYGKLGSDVLTGGAGRDVFVLDTRASSSNVDAITDFSTRSDKIWLAKSVFAKLPAKGILAGAAFWVGDKAHDGNDRIIYNDTTGDLSYDADGSG